MEFVNLVSSRNVILTPGDRITLSVDSSNVDISDGISNILHDITVPVISTSSNLSNITCTVSPLTRNDIFWQYIIFILTFLYIFMNPLSTWSYDYDISYEWNKIEKHWVKEGDILIKARKISPTKK